jgi:hypothetical protein
MLEFALGRPDVLRASRAQVIIRRWPEVVGATLAIKCVPDRYDKGVLWVAAEGNAWAQECRFQMAAILTRLNDLAGEELFTQLRVGTRPPKRDWINPES